MAYTILPKLMNSVVVDFMKPVMVMQKSGGEEKKVVIDNKIRYTSLPFDVVELLWSL